MERALWALTLWEGAQIFCRGTVITSEACREDSDLCAFPCWVQGSICGSLLRPRTDLSRLDWAEVMEGRRCGGRWLPRAAVTEVTGVCGSWAGPAVTG